MGAWQGVIIEAEALFRVTLGPTNELDIRPNEREFVVALRDWMRSNPLKFYRYRESHTRAVAR